MIGSSKSTFGFDPRTIPGCQLWLDAADATSLVLSGSSVTTWNDKSGNGNNATPYSTSPQRVGNSVLFSGSHALKCGKFLTSTSYSVFIVNNFASGFTNKQSFGCWKVEYGSFVHFEDGFISVGVNNSGNYNVDASTSTAAFNTTHIYGLTLSSSSTPGSAFTFNGSIDGSNVLVSGTSTSGNATTCAQEVTIGGLMENNSPMYQLNGYVYEVIVFNSALTTTQRQQVEGYLAHKWGLTGYYFPRTPLSIPGCQLWLDAADATSLVLSGSSVTTWNDKSGNGRNGTASGTPTYSSTSLNGRPAILIGSPNYFQGSLTNTSNTLSVFTVIYHTTFVGNDQRVVSLGVTGQNDYSSILYCNPVTTYGTTPNRLATSRNNVTISDFGNITPNTIFLTSTVYNGTDGRLYVNGTLASYSAPATSTGNFGYTNYTIGRGAGGGTDYFRGIIGEVLIYHTALTTSERQQVEGYLAHKWGFTTLYPAIPSTHPFYSVRPYLRAFNPTDISGCQLWLDAADTSSMTLSGSSVTSWSDKSGNGRNLTASSSYPTITTNGVLFNGSTPTILSNAASFTASTGLNSFVVFRSTVASTRQRVFVYTYSGQKLLSQVDTTFNTVASSNVVGDGSINYSANTTFIYSGNTTSSASISYSVNGVQNSFSSTPASTNSAQTKLIVGGESTVYFTGTIQEIILYDAFLTLSQRQQVEGYLAHKWGLTANLFSPLTISGCQLWLDAADITTITFGTGLSVASWRDKANNYAVANSSAANRPVYSQGTIRFDGVTNSSYLDIPTLTIGSSTFSIFFVIRNTGPASGNAYAPHFFWPLSGNGSGALSMTGWLSTNIQGINANITSTLLKNQYYLISYTFGVTTNVEQLYVNGTSVGTYSKGSAYASSLYRIGAINSTLDGLTFDGNIGEIIVYNTALTTTQRQQIEGYLSQKWGLGVSSTPPSTHPFYRIPPASVLFSPLNISGVSLWLDGADTSSMTLSGSSVTAWKDKSGNGYVMTNNQGTTSISTASLNSLTTVYTPSGTNSKITNFVGRTKCTMFLVGKAAISRYLLAINGGFLYTGNDSLLYFQPPTGTYLDLVDSVSGVVVSNNTWFILCIGYDNATNNTANPYTINGTTRTTIITPRGTPGILTDQNITSTLYINSVNGTNSYDSVYTAEILYYNNTLTTSQRQQVEGYLAQKWGLTGLLPSTHPFKKIPA